MSDDADDAPEFDEPLGPPRTYRELAADFDAMTRAPRLVEENARLRADLAQVREIVGAEPDEDTVAAVRWWLAERDHYEQLAERYRVALEYIAHFDRAALDAARTLHYDMNGVAREALAPAAREERADG